MAVTESERYELYQVLVEKLGAEGARTLMEHLPPAGWGDVATKHDLDHSRLLMSADLEQTRLALRADLDQHRAETSAQLDGIRAETKAQLDQHRAETSAQLDGIRSDLDLHRTEMQSALDQHRAETKADIQASELRLEAKIERGLRLNAMTIIGVNASLLTVVVTVLALLGR